MLNKPYFIKGVNKMILRNPQGRKTSEIRPYLLKANFTRYAEGSVLIQAGHTHVLCTSSILEEKVPHWIKEKGKGWIAAEYALLPRSTHTRTQREREKMFGRTHEIQRLISRALRNMVRLDQLGERSIMIDCDVLQADGGTRCAAITGGCIALAMALGKLIQLGKVPPTVWIDTVAAVSVGIHHHEILVDLDYQEDSNCEVDMNLVLTGEGKIVELQGAAEKKPFTKTKMDQMYQYAHQAIEEIQKIQLDLLNQLGLSIKK